MPIYPPMAAGCIPDWNFIDAQDRPLQKSINLGHHSRCSSLIKIRMEYEQKSIDF